MKDVTSILHSRKHLYMSQTVMWSSWIEVHLRCIIIFPFAFTLLYTLFPITFELCCHECPLSCRSKNLSFLSNTNKTKALGYNREMCPGLVLHVNGINACKYKLYSRDKPNREHETRIYLIVWYHRLSTKSDKTPVIYHECLLGRNVYGKGWTLVLITCDTNLHKR